jgi:hypothetical protein
MITHHAGVMMGADLAAALYRSFYNMDGEGGPPALLGTARSVLKSMRDTRSEPGDDVGKTPPKSAAPVVHWNSEDTPQHRISVDEMGNAPKMNHDKWDRVNEYFVNQKKENGRRNMVEAEPLRQLNTFQRRRNIDDVDGKSQKNTASKHDDDDDEDESNGEEVIEDLIKQTKSV